MIFHLLSEVDVGLIGQKGLEVTRNYLNVISFFKFLPTSVSFRYLYYIVTMF